MKSNGSERESGAVMGGQKWPGNPSEALLGHPCHTRKHEAINHRVKIEFVADEKVAKKIERAKALLRHKFPTGRLEDIIDQALEDLLTKRDPERKKPKENGQKKEQISESVEGLSPEGPQEGIVEHEFPTPPKIYDKRHVPVTLKRRVWQRDGGQCTYQSPLGKRCDARSFIQLDHTHPWALGGETSENNLKLLCATHNRHRAEQTYGHPTGIRGFSSDIGRTRKRLGTDL